MGFGWLIVGYFFVSVVALYSPLSFAMLAGFPMMILALRKLAPYHRLFRSVYYFSYASMPFAVYFSLYAFGLWGILEAPAFLGTPFEIVQWLYFAYSFVLVCMILNAVAALCRELSLIALQGNAMRNMILLGAAYFLELLGKMSFLGVAQVYLALGGLTMRLIVIFVNMILFYGCYRRICPAEEELAQSIKSKEKKGGEK